MKKIFFIIASCFVSMAIEAQGPTFQWAKKMGASGVEYGRSIDVDASGNVYTTGDFNGTVDFDPGPGIFNLTSGGLGDVFVSKFDALGNFIWAISLGAAGQDYSNSIAVDGSGNVHITGRFGATVDFDPGPGVYNLSVVGGTGVDVFILKLNSSGNFVWAVNFGGTAGDEGFGICLDASGNVYTTGAFQLTADFDPGAGVYNLTGVAGEDIFVSKLDASGNFVWAKNMGGSGGDEGSEITVDATGNVHIAGRFQQTVDFDPGPGVYNLTSAGTFEIFVCKLNALGNFVWAAKAGSTNQDFGYSIAVNAAGDVYTTGSFEGTVDFDPGAGIFNLTSAGGKDVFVWKLDVSGNFVWAKSIGGTGGDEGYSLRLDAVGDVYSTGYFFGTTDFDPGPGINTLTSAGSSDIYISKLDASGNFVWAKKMGGTANDEGWSIVLDAAGNTVYSTGLFYGTSDFDPGPGIFNLISAGFGDVFISKLCTMPSQPGAISGLTSMCAGSGTTIYSVNVVPGATSYAWTLPLGWVGTSTNNTISAMPGATGIFSVTANNGCGSSAQQTLQVTVNSLPVISVNSGSICSGNSFTIIPSGANTYTVQGGNMVVSPGTSTSYTIVGTSTAGCVSANSATSNVTVYATPTISVNSGSICAGNSFTMIPSGANTYTIQGGNAVVSPNTTTSYTVVGTSIAGCVSSTYATSNVTVTADPLPTITVNSGSICVGQTFTLNPGGASTYTIQGGSPFVTPSVTTNYTIVGTSSAGCISTIAAVSSVTVNANPTISLNSGFICTGQSFTINPSGASTYTISGNQFVVTPTVTTSYSVSGTSTAGCASTNTAVTTVTVNTVIPTVAVQANPTLICVGQSATLTASGANTYSWNTSASTPVIVVSPTGNTTYSVTGTATNACASQASVSLVVSPCTGIDEIHNSEMFIYPNPVQNNATISLKGMESLGDKKVMISNLLGQIVFETEVKGSEIRLANSNLKSGVYFIEIYSNSRMILNKKIIIE